MTFLDSSSQQMSAINAGSVAEQANIFHRAVSDNVISAHEAEEADSAVIPDGSQRNEEDDEYISKSDLDTDDEEISQKPQISERRRKQNKTFMSWFVLSISDACTHF